MIAFLPFLAVLGALPPLLTLAWLWQIKEWRADRMLEHLRREGWLGQLWGKTRPVIVAVYVVTLLIPGVAGTSFIVLDLTAVLLLLMMTGAAQIAVRRQRRPHFTQKAITLVGTAFALTVLCAIVLTMMFPLALPLLALLQPVMLALAWAAWMPVDMVLKTRILFAARAARERHSGLTVIGVTGSVGKTTTKELLSCVLQDLKPMVTPAHVNSEIGVARWLLKALSPSPPPQGEGPRVGVVIVEMGAYRTGEIATLCSFAKPMIGVVTHVGNQHIALFGSQEKLFQAKSELVRALPSSGRAFLNGDNAPARAMSELSPCPATIVGTGGRCDLEAFDIEETATGVRFRAHDVTFDVPLQGTHNVTNVLLALAVGEALGVRLERMRELLKTFTPLSGTFSAREESGVRILDDTHNSSAASVKAAIAWARNQPEQNKILLAAGLIEMGELQAPAEAELGALAAGVFERVIVVDPQSAKNFGHGAELFSTTSAKVPAGSLLVCTGRMSAGSLRKLLPSRP